MPEQKKCKYCAMMIPEEAISCPHCRRQLKTSVFTKISWIFIVIFSGLLIISYLRTPDKPISKTNGEIQEVQLTEEGRKIKETHSSWSNSDCNMIGEKKIRIGMNRDQVIAALGKPYKINETSLANRVHEKWIMSSSPDSASLYFENGILKTIQNSR